MKQGHTGVCRWTAIWILIVTTLLSLSLLTNCGGDDSAADPDGDTDAESGGETDNPAPSPSACPSGIVTNGFSLRWERLNHRISWYKLHPFLNACDPPSVAGATLDAAFIGGNFTTGEQMDDTPLLDYRYQTAHSPDILGFATGKADFALSAPENQAEQQVDVSLVQESLTGFDHYAVLVTGVEYDTRVEQGPDYPDDYDPAHGYTSRGIGAWCKDVTLSDDGATLSFTAGLRFDHAPSDRANMNRAIPEAKTKGALYYTVVGVENGALQTATVDYTLRYPEPVPLEDQVIEHAATDLRRVEIARDPDLPDALVGVTAFNFVLDPDAEADAEGDVPIGYYIREFAVLAELAEWETGSETGIVDFDGYASNATGFFAFYPLISQFTGEVAVIQYDGVSPSTFQLQEAFSTGAQSFELVVK